jgi:PAS domain S-box-containing protein
VAVAVLLQLRFGILGPSNGEFAAVLPFLTFPIVYYVAVRLGPKWAALVVFVFAILSVRSSMAGFGPFANTPLEFRLLSLQLFLAILAVTPLLLAAAMAEREAALADRVRSDAERDAFQRVLPDITYRIRDDGTYLDMYVPPGASAPIPRGEFIGRRMGDGVSPEINQETLSIIRSVITSGATEQLEYHREANGRRQIREARFVKLAENEVLCLVRDISDRKWAEETLAWQASVLEMMATGRPAREMFEVLVLGIERLSSGGLCSVLLVEGKQLFVAMAPSLPAEYNASIDGLEIGPDAGSCGRAVYHNTSIVVSDILDDPSWEKYKALARPYGLRASWSVPIRDSSGSVLGAFAVYYREPRAPDSRELALVERAGALAGIAIERERREDLLTSINRNVNEGLFRSTPDRGLLYVNSAFARMFGYDSPAAMLPFVSVKLYEDPDRRADLQRLIAEFGYFTHEEVRFVRRDGTGFWGMVSSTGVRGPDGSVQYYDGAIADITARKQLEERLRQAQKMEAVGKLAGGVAHDFNNLLTAITGYAHSLMAMLPLEGTARSDAEEITRAAERAAELTRQLLAYSRQQVLAPRVLELIGVVEELGGMLRRLIGEDVQLLIQRPPGNAWVVVDRGQIEQVIVNLVVNARDAMPSGGTLSIGTHLVELDEVSARRELDLDPGAYLCLSVTDTGTGMDAETRRRAFDPFFTTKPQGKGTGLGLSTVDGIVRQSGGGVSLESVPGAGTTVRVYLPQVVAPPTEVVTREPPAVEPDPAPPSGTILVVEDERLVRDLVCRSLRRAGYQVLSAEDGEVALHVSQGASGPIDLMVTDVIMPRMGGRELADRLSIERPELRVLFVSGYTNEAFAGQGMLEPGVEYLQKPFTPSALLARVQALLSTRRLSS